MDIDLHRPLQHITGKTGWINDPNGLIFFNGYYHIFFQYYPNDTKWGPMHWGHAITKDFRHIEYLEPALYPDEDGMCFSGIAIVKDEKLYLLYTSNIPEGDKGIQQQAIAVSRDGIHFEKQGLIIKSDDLDLTKYDKYNFRDPCVWKHHEHYYLLVAVKKLESTSNILMFKSYDLFKWEFVSEILEKDATGEMIECPDYNDNLGLLMYSEPFSKSEAEKHLNLHTNSYALGHINYETGKFEITHEDIADYGFDFYSSHSFKEYSVMLAWMDMWGRNNPTEKYGFAGMLTCPRKLSIKDGRLYQSPILNGELQDIRLDQQRIETKMYNGYFEIEMHNCSSFKILFNKGKEHYTSLEFSNDKLIFDRSHCGTEITGEEKDELSLKGIRVMPIEKSDYHKLIVCIDYYSIEVFMDGYSMTNTMFYNDGDDILEITMDARKSIFRKHLLSN